MYLCVAQVIVFCWFVCLWVVLIAWLIADLIICFMVGGLADASVVGWGCYYLLFAVVGF